MKTVYLFLADGFEEIEALATVDILRRAELDVRTVSITGSEIATGAHGVPVVADTTFEQTQFEDLLALILPGGWPGADNLDKHAGVKKMVLQTLGEGKVVAAICAAPMVLGKLGVLKGKKAICYPGFEEYLEGAEIVDTYAVKDGLIITGKAPAAAVDFALMIVSALVSEEKAAEVAAGMCLKA
ncbi:MAG: DJ-1/PfpI family protein [Bacteroides sp.]|nr:DJ-1/PfpI family protein [Bacteroides sp.]